MNTLILASNNQGKIDEFKAILTDWNIKGVQEVLPQFEVEEGPISYFENALLKAQKCFELTGLPSLGDDSGLEIKALNHRPGVLSARYGGDNIGFDKRCDLLLEEMKAYPTSTQRQARFLCALVYYESPHKKPIATLGTLDGIISNKKRGDNGFGYDPIFELTREPFIGKTFAEIPTPIKNQISHRRMALELLRTSLRRIS